MPITNRAYQFERNTDALPTMEEFISVLEKRAIALEDSSAMDYNSKATKVSNVATNNNCPYVNKMVQEINNLTKDSEWHYVSTVNNPADLLSRGCCPHKLQTNELWWHGPKELLEPTFQHSPFQEKIIIDNSSKSTCLVANMSDVIEEQWLIN